MDQAEVVAFNECYKPYFKTLNMEWIEIEPHRFVNAMLRKAENQMQIKIDFEWLPTPLFENPVNADRIIDMYDSFWCSPGGPYSASIS